MARPLRKIKRLSPEAEIRAKAKQIMAEREAEAYKAAALMIVSRKLDEITDLLRSAGFVQTQAGSAQAIPRMGTVDTRQNTTPPVAVVHPCTYCGVESVYRTKPNRYNRTGTWLCRAHQALRRQHEEAGTAATGASIRVAESGATGAGVSGENPQVVVNGGPALPPEKTDTGVDVGIADAFAALGVN